MIDLSSVSATLALEFSTLEFEVAELSVVFERTQFLWNQSNLPHAHHGYLMVCMSKIDFLSTLRFQGIASQTRRMKQFIDQYLYPGKVEEQEVAVKMFRHTLMHTGKLRFLYNKTRGAKYTWRLYWSNLPPHYTHFSITNEEAQYQDILQAINARELSANPSYRALNVSIVQLSKDLHRAALAYSDDLANDPWLQQSYETAMRQIEIQRIDL